MKKLTKNQTNIIEALERLTSVSVMSRVSVKRSSTRHIAMDVDGMSDNDLNNITDAGFHYGMFSVETNGHKCVALMLK